MTDGKIAVSQSKPSLERIRTVLKLLEQEYRRLTPPVVTEMASRRRTPFEILVGTVLSSRTKDEVTGVAARRLLTIAPTPQKILELTESQIEELIRPVGFYKVKARRLKELSRYLLEHHEGQVPDKLEDLLKIPGVGLKTANLVLSKGFNLPAICVDTHVHRISNRLGFVKTKTPQQTEQELRRVIPPEYWTKINDFMVAFGKAVCRPVSPLCSTCPLSKLCPKIGVEKHR